MPIRATMRKETPMFTKSNPIARSRRIAGTLWIVAGTLCLVPRLFFNGGGLSLGIGIMFIVFGIVSLTRGRIGQS